jgi:hypothetical protein
MFPSLERRFLGRAAPNPALQPTPSKSTGAAGFSEGFKARLDYTLDCPE